MILEPFQFIVPTSMYAVLTFDFISPLHEINVDILINGTYANNLDDRLAKRIAYRNSAYSDLRGPIEVHPVNETIYDIRCMEKNPNSGSSPGNTPFQDFISPIEKKTISDTICEIKYGPRPGRSAGSVFIGNMFVVIKIELKGI